MSEVVPFPKPNKRKRHGFLADNIVEFCGPSRVVQSPKKVLSFSIKDDFDSVVVIGVKDGMGMWRTSHGRAEAMFLMEQARRWMLDDE